MARGKARSSPGSIVKFPRWRTTLSVQRRPSIPLSRVVSAIQNVSGVQYVKVQVLDSISKSDTESHDVLKAKLNKIADARAPRTIIVVPPARVDRTGTIQPAGLAFLSPDLPDTLILTEITL